MIRAILFVSICLVYRSGISQDFAIGEQSVTIPNGFTLDVREASDAAYFHEEWLPGTLFYPNGSTRDYDQIKFNYHDNKLEIVVGGGELNVLPSLIYGFVIRESETKGHIFLVKNKNDQPTYFELLSNGQFQLLSHSKILTEKEDVRGTPDDEIRFVKKENIIEVDEKFFIYTAGKLKPLKQSRKAIIKATGLDKAVVEEYLDTYDLVLQLRSNLATLFDHLNSL